MFGNKEDKEAKKLEQLDAKMAQYGLENLSLEDKQRVRFMLMGLTGTSLIAFGSNPSDDAKITLMQTIIDQNFMLIKLQSELNNKLK